MTTRSLLELNLAYLTDLESLLEEASTTPLAAKANCDRLIRQASVARTEAIEKIQQATEQSHDKSKKEYDTTIDRITSDADMRLMRASGRCKVKRDSILDNKDQIHSKATERAGQDEWLAESMYESGTMQALLDDRRGKIHSDSVHARVSQAMRAVYITDDLDTIAAASQAPDVVVDEASIDQKLDDMETLLAGLAESKWQRFLRRTIMSLSPILGGGLGWDLARAMPNTPTAIWLAPLAGVIVGGLISVLISMSHKGSQRRRGMKVHLHASEALAGSRHRQQHLAATFQAQDTTHRKQRDQLIGEVHDRLQERLDGFSPDVRVLLEQLEEAYNHDCHQIQQERDEAAEAAHAAHTNTEAHLNKTLETSIASAQATYQTVTERAQSKSAAAIAALHTRWNEVQPRLRDELEAITHRGQAARPAWTSPDLLASMSSKDRIRDIAVGQIQIDEKTFGQRVPHDYPWDGPEPVTNLPIAADLDTRGGLLIRYDRAHRSEAMDMARATLLRVLTSNPPGMTQLTLVDPIGLGETFAGFMHLADLEDVQVVSRAWTDATHISQQFERISAHMETVIQSLLRNEFASLAEYNEQAGAIAEPYHIVVLADFPAGLTESSARRLASILSSGQRCGVLTIVLHDRDAPVPDALEGVLEDFPCLRISHDDNAWHVTDPPLEQFQFLPDAAPEDHELTDVVRRIGQAATGAHRVEVPFEHIAPDDDHIWTRSTADEIRIELGPSGANRLQDFVLGPGTTQHALIAGRTGSGKSTLLHVLITNLAMWYSPDEIEFHLVDFKKGVEFQTYAANQLPHARVVAIESDREFGLSVLRRLDEELRRRGQMFRDAGVQDIGTWRERQSERMPRILLVVDEFQEFFINDDAVGQEAGMLLDRLVRQGRAFGMHVLMGSQTLGGAFSLARSTMGQIGVRIALQCDEADSYLILSDDNPAARQLRRPGEAIYNDAGGKIDGNAPFQVAWLNDSTRDTYLKTLHAKAGDHGLGQFVFRGNIPSLLPGHESITPLLECDNWPEAAELDLILGDPIAIKECTTVPLRRQSGGNLMLVGQHSEAAQSVQIASLMQSAAILPPTSDHTQSGLMVWLLDGVPPDAAFGGRLAAFAQQLPHQVVRVTARNADEELQKIAAILSARQRDQSTGGATLLLLGLEPHRLAPLRPSDDDFMMSMGDDDGPPPTSQIFADLLRDGPAWGIHSSLWFDSLNNMLRGLDRKSQSMFTYRLLFQMSASDSGQLIDTTAASDLGLNRALLHEDDTGSMEKFRPWAMPDASWLAEVAARISSRHCR